MTVYRFFEYAFLPAADGLGRMVNWHDAGENQVDAALGASVFPYDQIGMVQMLGASGHHMQVSAVNVTVGGATNGVFPAGTLGIGFYIRFSGTAGGTFLVFSDPANPLQTSAGFHLGRAATGEIETYEADGLTATGTVPVANNGLYFIEAGFADKNVKIYSVSGTTHTLVDTVALSTNWSGGRMFEFQASAAQNMDIGAGYVADVRVEFGWKVAVQSVASAGTYTDAEWTIGAGASEVAALLNRDCYDGSFPNYLTCSTGAGKKKSYNMTPCGIGAGTPIRTRYFNVFWASTAAGGTTCRSGICYNGTDYWTNAFAPIVLLTTVTPGGEFPHGRGLMDGNTNWNVATPTVALLDSAQVMFEHTADGTGAANWCCAQLLTMFTPAAAAGGGGAMLNLLLD